MWRSLRLGLGMIEDKSRHRFESHKLTHRPLQVRQCWGSHLISWRTPELLNDSARITDAYLISRKLDGLRISIASYEPRRVRIYHLSSARGSLGTRENIEFLKHVKRCHYYEYKNRRQTVPLQHRLSNQPTFCITTH